ncbi:MAG: hypothetical protein ABSD72_13655 [Terracidiphilus sp.]|jgi:hypothetical protein
MNAAKLTEYGLVPVATCCIEDQKLKIVVTDREAVKLEKCIYAFLIDGKVVRIGSSKAPLEKRLKSYERDISNALAGKKSPAPADEADLWLKKLPAGTSGTIYARPGTEVTTPIGKFPAYLDEESILIGKIFKELSPDQILNRNKHR